MTPFQLITIPIAVGLAALSLRRLLRGDRPRWMLLSRLVVFAAAAAAIWNPEITNRVARALGIGRGADLLIYVVAVTVIVGFFYLYQANRRLEREITNLVRDLALDRAARPASPAAAESEGDLGPSPRPDVHP